MEPGATAERNQRALFIVCVGDTAERRFPFLPSAVPAAVLADETERCHSDHSSEGGRSLGIDPFSALLWKKQTYLGLAWWVPVGKPAHVTY